MEVYHELPLSLPCFHTAALSEHHKNSLCVVPTVVLAVARPELMNRCSQSPSGQLLQHFYDNLSRSSGFAVPVITSGSESMNRCYCVDMTSLILA